MARILALQTLNAEPDYTKTPCFSSSWSWWSIVTE